MKSPAVQVVCIGAPAHFITDFGVFSTAAAPRVAVDTLYLGVPAPGALALLGAAGLMGSRRRRG